MQEIDCAPNVVWTYKTSWPLLSRIVCVVHLIAFARAVGLLEGAE